MTLPRHANPRQHLGGFTLMEMVIAIVLLGLLAAAGSSYVVNNLQLGRLLGQDTSAQGEARVLMERLARELREVKFDAASQAYCVSTMGASGMVFNRSVGSYSDGCGGAAPDNSRHDMGVQLLHANGQLTLAYAGALSSPMNVSAVLASDVRSFGLRYLDQALAVTSSTAALRYVEVTMTIQPTGSPATALRSLVALRNR